MATKQPHIALFLRCLTGGGVERVMVNLARGFAEQNLKVDLVLANAEGSYLSHVSPAVRIVDFKAYQSCKNKTFKFKVPTGFQSTSSLPKLISYLKQEQPDALLAATHYPCEMAVLAKHLSGVSTRLILSEHTTLSVEARCVSQLSSRLTPISARLFYPWADQIVAVSQGVATDLAQTASLPLNRIQVIYNPVLTPEVLEKAKEPLDHPWFNPGEPPVILGAGRLVEQKDFSTLVRAFHHVRQKLPARLMILGSGKEKSLLKALVREFGLEEDVAIPGFVGNPYAYMAKSAVFVLSSAWEGFGNVIVEALAVGTPVVSTNCQSRPAEILDNGKYGPLVPVGDSKGMAEAILKVLSTKYQPVDAAWLENFTLQNVTNRYLEIMGINQTKPNPYPQAKSVVSC